MTEGLGWSSPKEARQSPLLQEAPILLEVREQHKKGCGVDHDESFGQAIVVETLYELIYHIIIGFKRNLLQVQYQEMRIETHLRHLIDFKQTRNSN